MLYFIFLYLAKYIRWFKWLVMQFATCNTHAFCEDLICRRFKLKVYVSIVANVQKCNSDYLNMLITSSFLKKNSTSCYQNKHIKLYLDKPCSTQGSFDSHNRGRSQATHWLLGLNTTFGCNNWFEVYSWYLLRIRRRNILHKWNPHTVLLDIQGELAHLQSVFLWKSDTASSSNMIERKCAKQILKYFNSPLHKWKYKKRKIKNPIWVPVWLIFSTCRFH